MHPGDGPGVVGQGVAQGHALAVPAPSVGRGLPAPAASHCTSAAAPGRLASARMASTIAGSALSMFCSAMARIRVGRTSMKIPWPRP